MLSVEELYDLAHEVKAIRNQKMRELPFYINVISAVAHGTLQETAHSSLLAALLNNEQVRASFIKTFVGHWADEKFEVKTEADRIDVSLEGTKHFIIVENKINQAPEQKGQVCRYAEIVRNKGYESGNIHLLYLNDTDRHWPGEDSMEFKGKNVFCFMEREHFKLLSYKHDILPWLQKLEIDEKEWMLDATVRLYADYLEQMFNQSKRYEEMTNATEAKLREYLGNGGCAEFLDNLTALQKGICDVRREVAMKLADKWMDGIVALFGDNNVNFVDTIEKEGGKRVEYDYGPQVTYNYKGEKIIIEFIIQRNEDCRPRWAIAQTGKWEKDIRKKLEEHFTLETTKDDYFTISSETTYEEMVRAAEKVKKLLDELQS